MKILSIKNKREFHIKFAFYAMQDIKFDASRHKRYWIAEYSKLKVPLPPIEAQKQLVFEVEKEEEIITANRRLIELMEKKNQSGFGGNIGCAQKQSAQGFTGISLMYKSCFENGISRPAWLKALYIMVNNSSVARPRWEGCSTQHSSSKSSPEAPS